MSNQLGVDLVQTLYGIKIQLSGFGEQPAVLVKFTFDFPPVLGEVHIFAAPSQWRVVSIKYS